MRIDDFESKRLLDEVGIGLTESEARQMRGALEQLLENVDRDWHAHVSSEDYQTEVTLWIEKEGTTNNQGGPDD